MIINSSFSVTLWPPKCRIESNLWQFQNFSEVWRRNYPLGWLGPIGARFNLCHLFCFNWTLEKNSVRTLIRYREDTLQETATLRLHLFNLRVNIIIRNITFILPLKTLNITRRKVNMCWDHKKIINIYKADTSMKEHSKGASAKFYWLKPIILRPQPRPPLPRR